MPAKGFVTFRDKIAQHFLKPPGVRRPKEVVEADETPVGVAQDAGAKASRDDRGDRPGRASSA